MGDRKDLTNQEAIEKIRELADGKLCLLCTYDNGHIVSRPMSTATVDDDGAVWFISGKHTEKNEQIQHNDEVYLMYMETGKQHYLSLTGNAEIITDRNKIDEVWKPIAKVWFKEGKEDPEVSLLKITPREGHYWDTKHGKLVSMLKVAASLVTGKTMDDEVEGDLLKN